MRNPQSEIFLKHSNSRLGKYMKEKENDFVCQNIGIQCGFFSADVVIIFSNDLAAQLTLTDS